MSRLFNERKKAYRERDWDRVIECGEMELKQDSRDIRVLNDLAYAYHNKKDYDHAFSLCETIHELIPSVDLTVQSKELGPRYMRYHEVLGEIYYLQGKDLDALRVFNRLKPLGPLFSKKYSLSAKIFIRRKDYQAAAKEYANMAVNCPRHAQKATDGLLDLVDMDPFSEATYRALFKLYNESKQLPSIISVYEASRRIGQVQDKFLFTLIHMYYLSGKHENAMTVIQDEIDKRPDNPYLQIFLGKVYQASMKFSQAIKCIQKAIKLDPHNEGRYRSFYDNLIQNLQATECKFKEAVSDHLKNKQCSEAIRACEQLLKIRPNNKGCQMGLVKVIDESIAINLAEGKIEEAVVLMDRLATLKHIDPGIPGKIAAINRQISGRRMEAYENLIAGGKVTGDELNRIRYELANIYLDKGKNTDRGIALMEEVIQSGDQYANDSLFHLALHLLKVKDLETVETYVQKFATISCSDKGVSSQMYDLGVACEGAGLKHQARMLYGKVLAFDKTFKDVAHRMDRLKSGVGGREIPVAVMVVDICESSRLMDLFGDEATYQIKNALEGIMIPIFRKHESNFLKSTGDGFLVTFSNSIQAADAAIQILKALDTYNSGVVEGPRIHLRFAIHFGAVRVRPDGDFHGTNVNIPFRVEGLKAKDMMEVKEGISRKEVWVRDRIFVTEAFTQDVSRQGAYNIRFMGLFELRNITGVHKIYQLMT